MSTRANETVVRLKDVRAQDVGRQVADALSTFADQLNEGVHAWSSKAKTAAKATDGLVRSNPWAAVGAIALVGLAAGIFLARSAARSRAGGDVRDDGDSRSEVSGG